MLTPQILPITDMRYRHTEVLDKLTNGPIFLTRHGVGEAVLLSNEQWEKLMAHLENQADVAEMRRDVDEMQAMLEDYLAFAKGDGGEAPENVDLSAMLADLRTGVERLGHVATLNCPDAITVHVRPAAIRRCFMNLAANAARYGTVVAIAAEMQDGRILVHVDDDGPGIPEHLREDVFRPFFRLDNARNQDVGGTGLGLAIARDIARGHGGDIVVGDSPLGGLRATVSLPF